MAVLASVAACVLVVASLVPAGLADESTQIPEESPWYSVEQDGRARIHFYYAYSST